MINCKRFAESLAFSVKFQTVIATAALSISAGAASQPALANTLTQEQALGKALFFDKSLSATGQQACGSCHSASTGFTDPDKSHPTSKGDNPLLFGNRNTPTAMYQAYSPEFGYDATEGLWVGGQFLDGRAATLEIQAMAPFLNPVEMGNASKAVVIAKLQNGINASAFTAVYGADIFNNVDNAYDKVAQAIASYERSYELSPFTSKFDYYLKGEVKLTQSEQRGLALFNDPMKGNCAACHISDPLDDGTPPLFTDFTYDNIGIPKNYGSDFLTLDDEFNPDGTSFIDYGLGGVLDDEDLYGAFKVSTLRNIAITGAYGHNGWFDTLDQIVDFYATRDVKPQCTSSNISSTEAMLLGCWPKAEFPDQMNVDELGNLPLNKWEKQYIVSFLGTLTDGYSFAAVPEPQTWALMIVGLGGVGAGLRRSRRRQAKRAIQTAS
ncbi:MAG: PEPxxWA-CTERM sorting domain-containing protein [Sphingomonas sp.]|nr:PEPxxWA-CTERM sorting domain-containing protein [Sphingomonas sp.]